VYIHFVGKFTVELLKIKPDEILAKN